MRKSMTIVYGVSLALHASLGVGISEIEVPKEPERIAITVVDAPRKPKAKKEEPPPPPPPPEPEIEAPKPKAEKVVRERPVVPTKATPPPISSTPAPTFGIAMTGGVGLGGVAVPMGDSLRAPVESTRRVATTKTLVEPKPRAAGTTACAEPHQKPRPLQMAKPEYTEAARAALVEGKVRVELVVDTNGKVVRVRVLEGLGHGLDEAAIRAVEAASFEPALACGKPVEATFVVSVRFSL